MPIRIAITGFIFCLCGVLGLWAMIQTPDRGWMYLSVIPPLLLAVGIGLLRGSRFACTVAGVGIILSYLVVAGVVVSVLFRPHQADIHIAGWSRHGTAAVPYVLFSLLVLAIFLRVMQYSLGSSTTKEYFASKMALERRP